MARRMNWDRVRRENLSRKVGTEWIGQDQPPTKPNVENKNVPESVNGAKLLARITIPGCTCNKSIGFLGMHRKSCTFFRQTPQSRGPKAAATFTLEQFASAICKTGQRSVVEAFLASLRKGIRADPTVCVIDRKRAEEMVQALQNELEKDSVPIDKGTKSAQDSLVELIKQNCDIYLQAKDKLAVKIVPSAAARCQRKLYRLRYLLSNRQTHAPMFEKAFTEGGIFCIERVELAPSSLQDWLKGALEGRSMKYRRHPDFALIVTAGKSPHELWNGQIDRAFLDRLTYLKASV